MKIIIAGAGKIGFSVASILASEGHDLTVLDQSPSCISRVSNNLDVICVEGNACSAATLLEAGADSADLLVATTRSDEVNMVCGISARKLGTGHVIVRIRDEAYLSETEFLREALGLSYVINPEYQCAMEISRILRFPSASRVDAFSAGNLELAEHRVQPGSRLDGITLKALTQTYGTRVIVALIRRGDEAIIPNGDCVIKAGDMLQITGESRELKKFFISVGEYSRPVKNVMIIGGGRVGLYLAKLLLDWGMNVTVVEIDKHRCEELCNLIPGAKVIRADGTRTEILEEEGMLTSDAFVAVTGDDGINIITSMYAKRVKVRKVVVKSNQEHYADIIESAGIDSVFTAKKLVSQQLARYVRAMDNSMGSSMETMYRLADGRAEALEFTVSANSRCVGIPLKTMRLKKGILICALVRSGKTIIPNGETVICPGDHAVIITRSGWLKELDSIIEE